MPTNYQLDLMRHALGLDEKRAEPWRNHFCASPGSANDAEWDELVSEGCARLAAKPDTFMPYNTYTVTSAGKALVVKLPA